MKTYLVIPQYLGTSFISLEIYGASPLERLYPLICMAHHYVNNCRDPQIISNIERLDVVI